MFFSFQCGPRVRKLKFEFQPGSMHPAYPDTYVGCVNGCDLKLLELLNVRSVFGQQGKILALIVKECCEYYFYK